MLEIWPFKIVHKICKIASIIIEATNHSSRFNQYFECINRSRTIQQWNNSENIYQNYRGASYGLSCHLLASITMGSTKELCIDLRQKIKK